MHSSLEGITFLSRTPPQEHTFTTEIATLGGKSIAWIRGGITTAVASLIGPMGWEGTLWSQAVMKTMVQFHGPVQN